MLKLLSISFSLRKEKFILLTSFSSVRHIWEIMMSLISMHESSNQTSTYNVETVLRLSVGVCEHSQSKSDQITPTQPWWLILRLAEVSLLNRVCCKALTSIVAYSVTTIQCYRAVGEIWNQLFRRLCKLADSCWVTSCGFSSSIGRNAPLLSVSRPVSRRDAAQSNINAPQSVWLKWLPL